MLCLSFTLVFGLILLIVGAEVVVRTSGALARFWGASEFVVGMIIIGFGTSLPELVVSLIGASHGNPEVCVGNIVGSNIYNLLLILGLSALIAPIPVIRSNRLIDLPIMVGATLLTAVLGLTNMMLGRMEGNLMLVAFIIYLIYSFCCFHRDAPLPLPPAETMRCCSRGQQASPACSRMGWAVRMLIITIFGLAILLVGGRMAVYSAVGLAEAVGISQRLVAILILATGTSLPELVTSLAALRRDNYQLLLGNLVGSNIFNALFILGLSSSIWPQSFAGIHPWDVMMMVLSAIVVWLMALLSRRHAIRRWHGALLLLLAAAYTAFLILM